ncbi:ribonuclease H-like domain-containing protein [Tanacetum coccineum]
MARSNDDIPPPPPPPQTQTPTQQAPHTVSTIKLPILKKGEYDIWAMKMEHYLAHTDYPIWEVIQRGNGPVSVSTDAKEIWEAIKSRFGGNDESKKMQKYILKQQFEGFSVTNSEGLHKGYDRFQSLLSQLEIHGAGVSIEDANKKFLRVFESDVKSSTASSSSTQNVAFVSENTSSTNEVSTAYGASSSSGHNPQREGSSSYTDELMYSFFSNQSSGPQLDHEDLEELDEFDLEEMDLKCQVAMIFMRLKKFYKKTGRKMQFDAKELVGFDKTKVECYNCHKKGHFARECISKGNQDSRRRDAWNTGNKAKDNERISGKQEEPKALVTLDGDGVDWTSQSEDDQMSARDKAGLGYGDQMNKGVLSYENEVFQSVFVSRTSDIEDSPVNDRYAEGMHAVPPLMTGIYIPSGPDKEIDDSQFTYGPKQSKPSESDARSSTFNTCVIQLSDAPIIEEYESDSEDEHVSLLTKEQETPSFAFINTVKHVNIQATVTEQNTCSQSSKPDKKNWKGPTWLFDLDYLTDLMNYQLVRLENQANKHADPKEANHSAGIQDNIDAGNSEIEAESAQDYFVLPIWSS